VRVAVSIAYGIGWGRFMGVLGAAMLVGTARGWSEFTIVMRAFGITLSGSLLAASAGYFYLLWLTWRNSRWPRD